MTLLSITFKKKYILLKGLLEGDRHITRHIYYKDLSIEDIKEYLHDSWKLDNNITTLPFGQYLSDFHRGFSVEFIYLFTKRGCFPSYIPSSPDPSSDSLLLQLYLKRPNPTESKYRFLPPSSYIPIQPKRRLSTSSDSSTITL